MESTSALEVSQRKVQPSQQQSARSSSESQDLASEFSKLFQAMFGGASASLSQASDPLAVFSEIEVAPPVAQSEEPKQEVSQKAETEEQADSKPNKESNSEDETTKADVVSSTPVEQQIQLQVAAVTKPDSPREAVPQDVAPEQMLAKAKPQLVQPQQAAVENSLQDAANQLVDKHLKKDSAPTTGQAPASAPVAAAPVTETAEEAPKVAAPKPVAQQPLAPVTTLSGETPAQPGVSLPNPNATTDNQGAKPDTSAAQLKASMVAALNIDPVHRTATAPQADLSKGMLGLKVEAVQKASVGESRAQRNAAARATQQELIDKVQKVIEDAARSKDGNSLSFRLEQPELGSLTVKLSRRNDELHARIIPDNHEVEATIRERIGELQTALQNAGIKVNQVHISVGQEYSETEMFQFGYAFLGQNAGQNDASEGGLAQRDAAAASRSGAADDVAVIDNNNGARTVGQVDRGMWVA